MASATDEDHSLSFSYTLTFALKLKKIVIVRRKYISYMRSCLDCGQSELWKAKRGYIVSKK
jgi:predicted nucleic-acid-binding Zn-ribbon protein